MSITKILNTVFDPAYWQKTPVTCFVAHSYPYQFMRKVLTKLEADGCVSIPRSRVQLSTQDAKALLPLLQQTILGQASFFWLGDVEDGFTQKNRDLLLTGLNDYAGDNRIALFVQEIPSKASVHTIQLPIEINADDGLALTKMFAPKIFDNPYKKGVVEALLNQNQQVPLNLFMSILDGLDLVHIKNLDDFVRYLTPMLPLNSELSKLSQAFFKRDRNFFKHWSDLSAEYPPVFWLAFWSDQWWRAFHLITFAQKKNIVLAKKMGFKLPYSFITKDWQLYQPGYFQNLLSQLYVIDYNIKRGHSFCFFDFLYAQHFQQTKIDRGY
jgi:hypothetical protein